MEQGIEILFRLTAVFADQTFEIDTEKGQAESPDITSAAKVSPVSDGADEQRGWKLQSLRKYGPSNRFRSGFLPWS